MGLRQVTLGVVLLCATAAWADKTGQDLLHEVVVRATRITLPAAASAQETEAANNARRRVYSSDAADLLQEVPGVSLVGAGGVSSLPAIHGLADDRLRVKVDGMDLIAACPNHMNPALSYFDPSQVGTLRVYAGLTPVSVGGDSIGGTIIAETAEPAFAARGQDAVLQGEAGTFYRSNGAGQGGNIAATFAGERLSVSYSGTLAQADNYEAGGAFRSFVETGRDGHTLPVDEVGSSGYETRNHRLAFALRSERQLLEIGLGYQDMPYQLYPNQRMDLLENTQRVVNTRWFGQFERLALEARVYHEQVEHFMDFGADKRYWYGSNSGTGAPCSPIRFMGDPAGTCAAGMPMYTEGLTTGAALRADIRVGADDLLRAGLEYQRYRLDGWWPASGGGMGPGTFWNIRDGERDRQALFVEWEAQPGTQWTTSLGLRFERVETDAGDVQGYSTMPNAPGRQYAEASAFNARDRRRSDDNWDFSALARWEAAPTVEVEFGYAHKLRSPSLYERYPWSTWMMAATMNNFVGDGNGYVGNPDLEPEAADTISATLTWHSTDGRHELRVAPYYTRVEDYIDAVRRVTFTPGNFNVLSYANQTARLQGVDLSGRMPLGQTPIGEFGLQAVVSYVDGRNRVSGDDLYNVMPLNARLRLTHRRGGWDNSLELVAVTDKDSVAGVRNEIPTAGYELVNLSASYSWQRIRVDLAVENLLDRFYSLPLGGAYIGQGRTMSMTGIPWGIAVPGRGRSVNVGLTARF